MLSLQELREYSKRVGVKAHPNCGAKKLKERIAEAISVPVNEVEDVILNVNNNEAKKEELKEVLLPEPKDLKVRVIANNNYEIEGLLLESKQVVSVPKLFSENERFLKKINRQVEIGKIEILN